MYSLAAPKARLFQSNRNVKALEYLIYLCSIHLCMCTILIWECCLCRIFIHPLMKHSDSCSFLFPTFSVISPLQSLPVTISLLFPFSHTVSTFSPSSTIHTHFLTMTLPLHSIISSNFCLLSFLISSHTVPQSSLCFRFPLCSVTSVQFSFSHPVNNT